MSATTIAQAPAASSSALPRVDLDKSQYDLSTYWGRVKHFREMVDYKTLFVNDEKLNASKKLVEDYKNDRPLPAGTTIDDIWKAKKITNAILHPDTKEKIPLPFRISFFLPGNLLIVAGMLGARSIPATIFWQSVNQTYNVCVNYANRNASNTMSTTDIAKSYAIALSSSVGTAVGLNEWVKRATKLSPAVKSTLLMLVPFTAVAAANVCNISAMRWSEITKGIEVKDEKGEVLGKSAVVGRSAVVQTIVSRVALVVPALVFAPIIEARVAKMPFVQARPWIMPPFSIAMLAIFIGVFLPLGFGIFPQNGSARTKDLESKFHNIRNSKGELVETVYYNKGL